MNNETWTALSVDYALNELPPETRDLFEAYAAANPAADREARAIAEAAQTARSAVRAFPDLAPRPTARTGRHTPRRRPIVLWLMRAAAACLLLAAGMWIGRRPEPVGQPSTHGEVRLIAHPIGSAESPAMRTAHTDAPPREEFPWAQYRLAHAGTNGIQVIALQP